MSKLVFGGQSIIEVSSIDPSVKPIVDVTESLLEKKRSFVGEIIVTLFEDCNLSCKFCNQDHDSIVGLDNIRSKASEIIKNIELLKKMRKTEFSIHLMGGEIFQDKFTESDFAAYMDLVEEVHNYCSALQYPIEFIFVSNLVHFNTARVKTLLELLTNKGINVSLGTSYDPAMRFNISDLSIFAKNLEIYKDWIRVVNVVLTAPNIRKFLNREIPHFDYIYEHFDVYFDYYTLEGNWEIMSPKDHELRDMFVWLAENYPNVHPISSWFQKETNTISCQNTLSIMPDGRTGRCTILMDKFKKKDETPNTVGEMEHDFINKMDCLSCEYFAQCGLGCVVRNHFNDPSRSMNYCWMKDVHAKIGEIKNVR